MTSFLGGLLIGYLSAGASGAITQNG